MPDTISNLWYNSPLFVAAVSVILTVALTLLINYFSRRREAGERRAAVVDAISTEISAIYRALTRAARRTLDREPSHSISIALANDYPMTVYEANAVNLCDTDTDDIANIVEFYTQLREFRYCTERIKATAVHMSTKGEFDAAAYGYWDFTSKACPFCDHTMQTLNTCLIAGITIMQLDSAKMTDGMLEDYNWVADMMYERDGKHPGLAVRDDDDCISPETPTVEHLAKLEPKRIDHLRDGPGFIVDQLEEITPEPPPPRSGGKVFVTQKRLHELQSRSASAATPPTHEKTA